MAGQNPRRCGESGNPSTDCFWASFYSQQRLYSWPATANTMKSLTLGDIVTISGWWQKVGNNPLSWSMKRRSIETDVLGGRPVGAEAGGIKMNTKDLPKCSMPAGPGVSSGEGKLSWRGLWDHGCCEKEPERSAEVGSHWRAFRRKWPSHSRILDPLTPKWGKKEVNKPGGRQVGLGAMSRSGTGMLPCCRSSQWCHLLPRIPMSKGLENIHRICHNDGCCPQGGQFSSFQP